MKDQSNISRTVFNQVYFRSLFEIPYANEMARFLDVESKTQAAHRMDILPLFEARYKGTYEVLKNLISNEGISQVLELAAGLSPQGMNLTDEFSDLVFMETDLQEIIAIKKDVVANIRLNKEDNLHLAVADALNMRELEKVLEFFDCKKEIVVTNSGLMNYLDLNDKEKLAKNIKKILAKFGGYWVTPDLAMHNERREDIYKNEGVREKSETRIKNIIGKSYREVSFASEKETDIFLKNLGFKVQKVSQLEMVKLATIQNEELKQYFLPNILQNIQTYGKIWIISL